jgi:hypothetical protein
MAVTVLPIALLLIVRKELVNNATSAADGRAGASPCYLEKTNHLSTARA